MQWKEHAALDCGNDPRGPRQDPGPQSDPRRVSFVNVMSSEIYPADVAVYNDMIAAVGDVEDYIGPDTEIIDARGQLPGARHDRRPHSQRVQQAEHHQLCQGSRAQGYDEHDLGTG